MIATDEFKTEPWYNALGDCIVYQMVDEALVADRIDEILTIYRSGIDDRPIGYEIKDVLAIIQKYGFEAIACTSGQTDEELTSVSIAALLLVAYEEGPKNTNRRHGYAAAMEQGPAKPIPRNVLVPA
jgi:hypothetical protein